MQPDKIIQSVTAIIRSYLSTEYRVLLFGSWAKGKALPSSDIDIAILGRQKVGFNTMAQILDKLDDIPTLRSIDIIDLQTKDKRFRETVLEYAKELH